MSLWDKVISALCATLKKTTIGVDVPIIGTGYESMKSLPRLLTGIFQAYENPDYRPVIQDGKIAKTFCNEAVQHVAKTLGCLELEHLNADQIVAYISKAASWKEVMMRDCQFLANQGSLIVAGLPSITLGDGHGHVCVIRPGEQIWSEHWKSMVPAVMNIGGQNFILRFKVKTGEVIEAGVNGAFQMIPRFYAWQPSL